jgi:hypothetical protein
MEFTEMAEKKIRLMFPGEREMKEYAFLHEIILKSSNEIKWHFGLSISDIPEFSKRCMQYGVRILGFEIHPDSPYPLQETCYEEYSSEYDPEWYLGAIKLYRNLGIEYMILPVIHVDNETLAKYIF